MILLSLDFETTGTDVVQDRVIEVGAVLWTTTQHRSLESAGFLVKSDLPVLKEITDLTKITQAAVDKFGFESAEALNNVLALAEIVGAFVGQNITRFDKRILENWCIREHVDPRKVTEKLTIDTLFDIPGVQGRHLGYMAADHEFLNPFPHAALSDCQTVLKIIDKHTAPDGNIEPIIERARSPWVILQSHQPRGDASNKLAKDRKFRWQPDLKIWWRATKELDVEAVKKEAPFDITIRPDLTIDQLWTD
jgi:DNA polymerase-3 subunit epsilon